MLEDSYSKTSDKSLEKATKQNSISILSCLQSPTLNSAKLFFFSFTFCLLHIYLKNLVLFADILHNATFGITFRSSNYPFKLLLLRLIDLLVLSYTD